MSEIKPSFWWFARASYAYKAERSWRSKVRYVLGVIPAWRRFGLMYSVE